jgi:radical SAM superfamily enzyme YgiQ (UPF0313 family)
VRVLLVQPAAFEPGRLGLENSFWLSEPVSLTSLAAMVPEHEVRILDMRLEPDSELNRVLLEFRPQLVGTTSMTTDCYQAKAVMAIAKGTLGAECFTVVGGHHPTLSPEAFEEEMVDAICLGEGEDTFKELVAHVAAGGSASALHGIRGLRFREADGRFHTTPKRLQNVDIDTFPHPARHLIPERYKKEYFFFIANPMASMFTSRGCSFDCNFCAIWEFYERRTRFMSAKAICDRLETMPERYVFLLDDNFLTSKKRLEELCSEIETRGIKKYLLTQGRTDFIAENPELMRRLRDCGLMMVLSGYETNDDSTLDALRKKSTRDQNLKAIGILRELGILSTGIFMARPEFSEQDFDLLFETVNEMGVHMPLLTILTPLPGTELYRRKQGELLTKDVRFFDLLHAVTPTKLPRPVFYKKYVDFGTAIKPSIKAGFLSALKHRPGLFLRSIPGILRFRQKARRYAKVEGDVTSWLRDEVGVIPADVMARPAPHVELPVVQEVRS